MRLSTVVRSSGLVSRATSGTLSAVVLAFAPIAAGARGPAAAPVDHAAIVLRVPPSATLRVGPASQTQTMRAHVTAYAYYDNTPPGSAEISHPARHQKAGGRGTYDDPITVAVGHRYVNGRDVLDYARGTRVYLPYLHRYFIVEDTCGDGPHPEEGPCHLHPKGTAAWLDIWIDGKGSGARKATRCAEKVTGDHRAVLNPRKGLPVTPGPISRIGGCG